MAYCAEVAVAETVLHLQPGGLDLITLFLLAENIINISIIQGS